MPGCEAGGFEDRRARQRGADQRSRRVADGGARGAVVAAHAGGDEQAERGQCRGDAGARGGPSEVDVRVGLGEGGGRGAGVAGEVGDADDRRPVIFLAPTAVACVLVGVPKVTTIEAPSAERTMVEANVVLGADVVAVGRDRAELDGARRGRS